MSKKLDQVIWNKWSKGKSAKIVERDNSFVMNTMPFRGEFKKNSADDRPFIYTANGKHISFKPVGLCWDNEDNYFATAKSANGAKVNEKVAYKNVFGNGVDIEMAVDGRRWHKEVVFRRPLSAPEGASYLEIEFEIKTDFDLGALGDECVFEETLQLDELSRIDSIQAWRDTGDEEDRISCNGVIRQHGGKTYLAKQIPVSFLTEPFRTDIVITYGSEYVFNSATTTYTSCTALDSTHFVVTYKDDGGSDYGCAKIGVISSGDQIAYGSEYVFNSANTNYISCAALDSTHFVIAYRDEGNSNYGTAIIGTISNDDEITYGSEYVFNSAATSYISCSALDATHFVVSYADVGSSYYATAIIGVVSSGDEVAFGSKYVFNAVYNTSYISCSALDATHFVVGYRDEGGDDYGCSKIGVVSNADEIAYGSEYVFNAASTYHTDCSALDPTHFVVGYRDDGNSAYGTAIIGVVSNADEIAYGSEYVFNAASTDPSCSSLDSTHFVVCYPDASNSVYGTAIIGVVSSGDEIAYGSEYVFNSALTDYVSCAALDSTHFVIAYRDEGNSNYGTAIVGVIPSGYVPRNSFVNFQGPGVF